MQFDPCAGFLFGFGAFTILLIVLASIFWIWMLIDCIKNERLTPNERIIWALIVFFLHGLGALIYFLVGRKKV